MSDFTKSIVYSGFVLVAGLVAIFAISSNMTVDQTNGTSFAVIEPAAGDETNTFSIPEPVANSFEATQDQAEWATEEALAKLRDALKEAGVDVSKTEPAAGEEAPQIILDTTTE